MPEFTVRVELHEAECDPAESAPVFDRRVIGRAIFAFPVANFHLTAFASDFRRIHRLMDVHRHSHGITPGEKAGRKWRPLICYLRFMFSREIQLDTHGGPVTLTARWLRVPGAVKYSGLSRSKLYELLSDGRIRSICVRSQKGAQRGVRLIDRESIDSFMESQGAV